MPRTTYVSLTMRVKVTQLQRNLSTYSTPNANSQAGRCDDVRPRAARNIARLGLPRTGDARASGTGHIRTGRRRVLEHDRRNPGSARHEAQETTLSAAAHSDREAPLHGACGSAAYRRPRASRRMRAENAAFQDAASLLPNLAAGRALPPQRRAALDAGVDCGRIGSRNPRARALHGPPSRQPT